MKHAGHESWQIREERWSQYFDWALWIRAAERIDVPAGGIVPGALLIDRLPEPSPGLDQAVLAAEWVAWWRSLFDLPREGSLPGEGDLPGEGRLSSPGQLTDSGEPPPRFADGGPDLDGLAGQPLLREVLARRWMAAHRWHSDRKLAGLREYGNWRRQQSSAVMREFERTLGRRARPFALTIDVLPVDDPEVRAISDTRFLVSERIRDSSDWAEVLRGLVGPLA